MNVTKDEYHPYAQTYIDYVIDSDPVAILEHTQLEFYEQVPSHKMSYRYAEGKWSIPEILGHIMDTERIFSYRLLRIARGDKTALAGFEQDDYVVSGRAGDRSWLSLLAEYESVRLATMSLIDSLCDEDLLRTGTASNHTFSARAFIYMMAGHELHHIKIIQDRYL